MQLLVSVPEANETKSTSGNTSGTTAITKPSTQ